MDPDLMKKLLEGVISFALIAGILVALADTRFYGLAIGIVGIALLYVLLSHPKAATALSNVVKTAGKTVGG